MFKSKPINLLKQGICYLLGLLIISVGINFSKMSDLGISPVSSIPRACEEIWGLTLGNTTMIVYILLVILQFLILRKNFKLTNALGIVVTFIFSWMIDFTGSDPKAFGHLLLNFPRPEGYPMKFLYMFVSLFICAIGVFLYLRPKWVPMPAEGFAGAISFVTGKPFGDCKTIADTTMVVIALILQLVSLGGFSSFFGDRVVVREGTIIAAVAIGQIVKVITKKVGKPIEDWLHKGEVSMEPATIPEEELPDTDEEPAI